MAVKSTVARKPAPKPTRPAATAKPAKRDLANREAVEAAVKESRVAINPDSAASTPALNTTAKWPGVKAFKVVTGAYALQCPYCAAELVNPADGSHTFTENVSFNGATCSGCGVQSYVPLSYRAAQA